MPTSPSPKEKAGRASWLRDEEGRLRSGHRDEGRRSREAGGRPETFRGERRGARRRAAHVPLRAGVAPRRAASRPTRGTAPRHVA